MNTFRLALAVLLCGTSVSANAATILGWNLDNVQQVPNPIDPTTGVSKIYDRDVTGGTTGARSNGTILWTKSPAPGLTVLNDDADLNPGQSIPDCMVAVGSNCEGPFQSDKRIKMVANKIGAIDLQFDTMGNAESNSYQLFHRIINETPQRLSGFTVELGFGIGNDFVRSGSGDGLSFDLTAQLGPNNQPSYTQFSFGMFGNAATNPNFTLDGFFATQRAGFNMVNSEDRISTAGLFGPYDGLFGPGMLNTALVPEGYFWDNDGDELTDPLLMAWFNGTDWEQRRIIDPNDPTAALSATAFITTEAALQAQPGFEKEIIEDLRNLNLNLNILTGPNFNGDSFTLRFVTNAVPEPGTWAMLIAGFGLVGASMRRRRQVAATA